MFYYRVPEFWRKTEKLAFLVRTVSMNSIDWQELQPDENYTWLTEGIRSEFAAFLPIGTKEAKSGRAASSPTIFKNYGRGVATCRDDWAYDFDSSKLAAKIERFIDTYNSEVDRWRRRGSNTLSIDNFVTYDDTKIKWSEGLKSHLQRSQYIQFSDGKVRSSFYRPFCREWIYFDRGLIERVYQFPQIFPTHTTEDENAVICVSGIGSNKPFHTLVSTIIPCLDMLEKTQCFPYYTYTDDGKNRRENITDWALSQFQGKYGSEVTKWNIFHYVYALLHHPQYRERYAENLKRDLPHIPLLQRKEAFLVFVRIGQQLMEMHLRYEQAKEYPLKWTENNDVPFSWRVEKMQLTPDKTAVIVNQSLMLEGIPQETFHYELGNRSALEWVIDQYQIKVDKRSGIVSNPNQLDDEEYIVHLVGKVVTVSIETVRLVTELSQTITQEDGMSEEALPTV